MASEVASAMCSKPICEIMKTVTLTLLYFYVLFEFKFECFRRPFCRPRLTNLCSKVLSPRECRSI